MIDLSGFKDLYLIEVAFFVVWMISFALLLIVAWRNIKPSKKY